MFLYNKKNENLINYKLIKDIKFINNNVRYLAIIQEIIDY